MAATDAPDLAQARAFHAAGRLREAESLYRGVLARDPNNPAALHFLGVLASQTGHNAEAEPLIRAALALRPDDADAHNNLGLVLSGLARYDEAVASFDTALALNPAATDTRINLGNSLSRAGRLAEAEAAYRGVLDARPDDATAWHNLGIVLKDQGRLDEAVAAYRTALSLQPDMAEAHHALGISLLLAGQDREGWAEYEWRWRDPGFPAPRRTFPCPLWDGAPLPGGTLLVHAEQGLGDTLQFARLCKDARTRVGRVVLACDGRLAGLLAGLDGVDALCDVDGAAPPADAHVPLLSLPHLLDIDAADAAVRPPYLHPDPALVGRWRDRFSAAGAPSVGLVWAGNPDHPEDARRSLAFDRLAPILAVGGIAFHSLQFGPARAQMPAGSPVADLADEIGPFEDMAAAVAALDLMIAVDTAPVHLAGALDRPAWLLLMYAPDWRWRMTGDASPWYPSVTLFRQPSPGDWDGVIAETARALAAWRG